jgi:hypothetical protein
MSRPAGLFVLLAAAACASAQVTLSTVQGPVGSLYDFKSVALGSVADVEFRLTNTGPNPAPLSSLALAGTNSLTPPYTPYFSVVCPLSPDLCKGAPVQQLPITIKPTGTLDFTVQFEPFQLGSPSATMTICTLSSANCTDAGNTITVFLRGTGVAGLSVLWKSQPLGVGETVTFGNVQVGSSQTIALTLSNQTNPPVPLTVPAIPPLTGGTFSLAGSALSGPTVAPGSSAELDVIFTPTATGPQQATLTIGLSTYPLQGTGVTPPPPVFPTPSIQLNLATLARQGSLSVNLASGSVSSGSGTVTLAFQSAVSGVSDDPTIAFINADGTSSASAAFTVVVGASEGRFAGGPSVSFGTGTTAGTLVFTVTLGAQTAQTTVTIPRALIGIDAAVAARNVACAPTLLYCTTTNVQLQINGWDNTRSASQLVFTFFNSSGVKIPPSPIIVDGTAAFQSYFSGSDLGGVFGLSAFFPVNGDSNQVVAALVQIFNSECTLAQFNQRPPACTVPTTTITF